MKVVKCFLVCQVKNVEAHGHFGPFRPERIVSAHTKVKQVTRRNSRRIGIVILSKKACDRARIPFGLTVEGGVIWHDLRRTFATELRGRQVHEYDIADLLGHTIQSVTGTYARSTPEALEDAANRLTEPRGTVVQFKRKAS